MYELRYVDLAGNDSKISQSEEFETICNHYKEAREARSRSYFYICNPDRVDIGCEDGLTEEERELLP